MVFVPFDNVHTFVNWVLLLESPIWKSIQISYHWTPFHFHYITSQWNIFAWNENTKVGKAKKKEIFEERGKWFNSTSFRNKSWISKEKIRYKNNHLNAPIQSEVQSLDLKVVHLEAMGEPLKCWGYNGPHQYRNFPYNSNWKNHQPLGRSFNS